MNQDHSRITLIMENSTIDNLKTLAREKTVSISAISRHIMKVETEKLLEEWGL